MSKSIIFLKSVEKLFKNEEFFFRSKVPNTFCKSLYFYYHGTALFETPYVTSIQISYTPNFVVYLVSLLRVFCLMLFFSRKRKRKRVRKRRRRRRNPRKMLGTVRTRSFLNSFPINRILVIFFFFLILGFFFLFSLKFW